MTTKLKRHGQSPKQSANRLRMMNPARRQLAVESAREQAAANPGDEWATTYLAAVLIVAAEYGIE